MELVVGGLFVSGLVAFARMHAHIESKAAEVGAQQEHEKKKRFVREVVSEMDRESALRQTVRDIARDEAQSLDNAYDDSDKEVVRRLMREIREEEQRQARL